jgi:hypothetical protein
MVTQVAEGPQPVRTPADILRSAYEQAAAEVEPKDIQVRGYGEPDSELHVLYRMLDDYAEVRGLTRTQNRKVKPEVRDVEMAIDTLQIASVGSYAVVGGERHDLGEPLGLGLYNLLFPEDGSGKARPGNDRQAIIMLYHGKTLPITLAYTELDAWIKNGGVEAEDQALGE